MNRENLLLKVQIFADDGGLQTKSGTSKRTGNDYNMRWQTAYAFLGGRFPEKFDLMLGDDQQPYPPGVYYRDEVASSRIEDHRLDSAFRVTLVPVEAVEAVEAVAAKSAAAPSGKGA